MQKQIKSIFTPAIVPEGKGAFVRRIIGNDEHLRRLDPFLMLDNFSAKLPAGFPDHPHRGFETVTYVQHGSFCHEDFLGNKGMLNQGDIQWMTAGKGILHSEMPCSFEEENSGFQLWINLRSDLKMCEPEYQEIKKDKIPIINQEGVSVKLISGEAFGVKYIIQQKGPIRARTPAYYMDFTMQEHIQFEQTIPSGWNSLIFVYQGSIFVGSNQKKVEKEQACVFEKEQATQLKITTNDQKCSFILIAGLPLNEPIESYGPFVMNTRKQINDTIQDYQQGQNGFENAANFKSKIKHLVDKNKYDSIMKWLQNS